MYSYSRRINASFKVSSRNRIINGREPVECWAETSRYHGIRRENHAPLALPIFPFSPVLYETLKPHADFSTKAPYKTDVLYTFLRAEPGADSRLQFGVPVKEIEPAFMQMIGRELAPQIAQLLGPRHSRRLLEAHASAAQALGTFT